MLFQRSGRYKEQLKASRKRVTMDTRLIIEDLKRLNKERPKNVTKAMQKHRLLLTEIGGLIANYFDWTHNDNKDSAYEVSSLFLRKSFELLNRREVESLHFVTGPEVEGKKVLSEIVDLRLEEQSVVYAKAESEAIREALIYLSDHGFKLWGCFHIHPGNGPLSILPSGTDKALDRLLNQGGYDCVGAIFSRDGYVRFFSSKRFEIKIYGKGVEKINEKLYRITKID